MLCPFQYLIWLCLDGPGWRPRDRTSRTRVSTQPQPDRPDHEGALALRPRGKVGPLQAVEGQPERAILEATRLGLGGRPDPGNSLDCRPPWTGGAVAAGCGNSASDPAAGLASLRGAGDSAAATGVTVAGGAGCARGDRLPFGRRGRGGPRDCWSSLRFRGGRRRRFLVRRGLPAGGRRDLGDGRLLKAAFRL